MNTAAPTDAPRSVADLFVDVGQCRSTGCSIRLCYNTFGDPKKPCMLLIMGLGLPGTAYDNYFCRHLAKRGFYVVRFDNRDVGQSTHLLSAPIPNFYLTVAALVYRTKPLSGKAVAYSLSDMAEDTYNLLRALNIPHAHLVGMSMGGMIAQHVLMNHPECVLSMGLVSSGASGSSAIWPSMSAKMHLAKLATQTLSPHGLLKVGVRLVEDFAGDMPVDHDACVRQCERFIARKICIRGVVRQLTAFASCKGDDAALHNAAKAVPTVIIHGDKDILVPVQNAKTLKGLIPHASVLILPGLGHSLHPSIQPLIVDALVKNALSAKPVTSKL